MSIYATALCAAPGLVQVTRSGVNSSAYTTNTTQADATTFTTVHEVTDDGAGSWGNSLGLVTYGSKAFTLKLLRDTAARTYKSDHQTEDSWQADQAEAGGSTTGGAGASGVKGGEWATTTTKDVLSGGAVEVTYKVDGSGTAAHTMTFTPPPLQIDLCPHTRDSIIPGSVQFTWMGHRYQDFEGTIYRGRDTSPPGVVSGTINYTAGVATMTDYVVGVGAFALESLWTRRGDWNTAALYFRTAGAPLQPGGFVLSVVDASGASLTANANLNGEISGTHVKGKVEYETGVVEVLFGDYVLDSSLTAAQKAEWWYNPADIRGGTNDIWRPWPIDPTTARYNAVVYKIIPLSADILGLDPVRLPSDGRVPIFRSGDVAVVHHTDATSPLTVSNSQVINCGRQRLARVRVVGNNGVTITTGYTTDLDAGTVTFTNVAGFSQPIHVEHTIEDMALVSEAQITGQVGFTRQLTHDFPVGSLASSALLIGNMRARVPLMFDQQTWSNTWADAVSGSSASATYNDTQYPVVVENFGAVTERWVLKFTNTTTFDVIGEHVGLIATGTTAVDLAPINPATGTPYFTVKALGFGGGWAAGNALRFNTVGALFPVDVVRTIQQGPPTAEDDSFTLLIRGDVDRP